MREHPLIRTPMFPTSISPPDGQANRICILGTDVPVYSSELCKILTHIKKPGESGTPQKIAIISPTSYSRTMLADNLSREISVLVRRIDFAAFEPDVTSLASLFDEERVYVCENCQYLFERRPHGFDLLRSFLGEMITNPRQIITTWNQYSWNFLSGFLHIEQWFPVLVRLSFLALPALRQFMQVRFPDPVLYVMDADVEDRLEIVKKDLHLGLSSLRLSLSIPYLTFSRRYSSVIPFRADLEKMPEEIIMRTIFRKSLGDPGVAMQLYNTARVEDQIRLSLLSRHITIPSLSTMDNYLLSLILMYEQPGYSRLLSSIQDQATLNSSLYRLSSAGVISRFDDGWGVLPDGFAPAVEYLVQRRMIW